MRRLCIVAHGAPMLYGYLIVALERDREGPDPIEIVVDRRRAGSGAPAVERRKPSAIDQEIATRGFVVLDENGAIVRALEPPSENRLPAWKAQALRARDWIETAWRAVPTARPFLPALPSLTRARDGLEVARQQSLSTVTWAREGLQSRWQAVAAMAQAVTPGPSPSSGATGTPGGTGAPGARGRLPRRPRTLWMLGGAVAAVAAAAAFVALEPPDPPDPAATRGSSASSAVSTATVATVDGPRAEPSVASTSPAPAGDTPAPAVVSAPPIAAPAVAVETPASDGAPSRQEPAPDRAAVATREPAATQAAAASRETPASARPAAARETPAAPQMAAIRETPPPRHAAAARSAEAPDARPGGPPRVELQSDAAGRAEARTITYTARLSDTHGRPLVNAAVSVHGWLPDGSDVTARLASTSTPGVYRASVPVGPRTPSNLRVLVAHGGKRFEVAPQRRAL